MYIFCQDDGGDKLGGQEGRIQRIEADGEEAQHEMLEHFLQEVRNNPRIYYAPRTVQSIEVDGEVGQHHTGGSTIANT